MDNKHVYERDVEFSEYYNCFIEERRNYPAIITNILDFEIHFKSILAYRVLTQSPITNSNDLNLFLDKLKVNFANLSSAYDKRKNHMIKHIEDLKMMFQSTQMFFVSLIE